MLIKPEHDKNWTPMVRSGVLLLLDGGEVVYVTYHCNIYRQVVEIYNEDKIKFGAFSWVPSEGDEMFWLADELTKLYKPKYNQ